MKVLLILKEHQVEIEGISVCPLNQQEIANQVPCGKLKANQMIKELIDGGYVEMMRIKGRYIITTMILFRLVLTLLLKCIRSMIPKV